VLGKPFSLSSPVFQITSGLVLSSSHAHLKTFSPKPTVLSRSRNAPNFLLPPRLHSSVLQKLSITCQLLRAPQFSLTTQVAKTSQKHTPASSAKVSPSSRRTRKHSPAVMHYGRLYSLPHQGRRQWSITNHPSEPAYLSFLH
jgi:hypothetical protein